jgi:hypothetical protein
LEQRTKLDIEKLRTELIMMQQKNKLIDTKFDDFTTDISKTISEMMKQTSDAI